MRGAANNLIWLRRGVLEGVERSEKRAGIAADEAEYTGAVPTAAMRTTTRCILERSVVVVDDAGKPRIPPLESDFEVLWKGVGH